MHDRKTVFRPIIINVMVWLVIIFLMSLLIFSKDVLSDSSYLKTLFRALIGFSIIVIIPVYINTLILIPKYLVNKKYFRYILSILLISIGWTFLSTHITNFFETHLFDSPLEELDDPSDPIVYLIMFFLLLTSTIINLSYRWFVQQNKIKNERLTMELTILKNQINPHFFFNTLNNLYALSMEKSDETPKVILKLSEMMRYTIYECQEAWVTLDKELRYLENYIELQKIRLHKRAKIDFVQNIENDKLKVAPMLLIVFLENSFKHGIDGMEDHCEIGIVLESFGNRIFYTIKNNYRPNTKKESGMGIKNVKRRLDLIYPKTHSLRIDDNGQDYYIELELEGKL